MFNSSNEFVVPIISGHLKECKLRFPSDEEWCKRARKQRVIRRALGRGRWQYEPVDPEAIDAELFATIRLDQDGEPFDEADASTALAKLELAVASDAERSGPGYRIGLKVPQAVTAHILRIPTQKQMLDYRRASVNIIDARRHQEVRVLLEPAGTLYDKLVESVEGYTGPVPIIHKAAILTELQATIDAESEESSEDF